MRARTLKVTILGDPSVGKTTLIHSFVNDEFRADFSSTVGTELSSKYITVQGQQIQALIWDTAGTERFNSMTKPFYRGTDACILVADLTSAASFDHLTHWRDSIVDALGIENTDTFPFAVFANKADLLGARVVSEGEVNEWGTKLQCPVFEVSAENGQNVETGFKHVLEQVLENSHIPPILLASPMPEPADRQGCC